MLDVCVAGQNFASPSASQILTDPNRFKGTRCSHGVCPPRPLLSECSYWLRRHANDYYLYLTKSFYHIYR
ncbi:hypothetical protein BCIN_03g03580 [Botrytis cinerea B05.10]|uniref:Uncharacterized protein n=1 Tax=Botryotinia fuckeliana (strain B05.10) TaxID=332648 RepID=A0A384JCD8_BOTFB|nr:hypothetical protein BCIN_03g03580 [Botrytis cinerea B05.10]ATZ48111.1 hypothetical protein BCIN_03g03580 [Botrytis cinerea B05.10]